MSVAEQVSQGVDSLAVDARSTTGPYDSIWARSAGTDTGFEGLMLSNDKLYVVLAIVLIIWFGLLYFLYRNDRRLARLERSVGESIADTDQH